VVVRVVVVVVRVVVVRVVVVRVVVVVVVRVDQTMTEPEAKYVIFKCHSSTHCTSLHMCQMK